MITIPKHGELEQRVTLLMHIGRDVAKRGEGGFNVDLELKGTLYRYPGASKERYEAWEFLKERNLIEVYEEEKVADIDGEATFVKCRLTERGQRLYGHIENKYEKFLESLNHIFL